MGLSDCSLIMISLSDVFKLNQSHEAVGWYIPLIIHQRLVFLQSCSGNSLFPLYRIRSNSIENFLDDNDRKQKYENVTDEDLAANKHALSASLQLVGGGSKKPPRPLPRPARPEH